MQPKEKTPTSASSEGISLTRGLSRREVTWRALFVSRFPDELAVWEKVFRGSFEGIRGFVQIHFAPQGIEPETPFGSSHSALGLSEWGVLHRYLTQIQKCSDSTARHTAEVFDFALLPRVYSLSADEIRYLADFLDCYPGELALWKRMFGKTPNQFSNIAISEAVERGLLSEGEAQDVRRKLSIGRTWELLSARLRASVIVQAMEDQRLADYIDLLRTLMDCLPQRHDHYDAHRQLQEPENWATVPFAPGPGESGKEMAEYAGTEGFVLPPKDEGRCRLCWRPVQHNP